MCLMAAGHPLLLLPGRCCSESATADQSRRRRHPQPARAPFRRLFFSIKQTGVPLGVALAGLAMPALPH
jgi:hypothetical protein